MSICHGCGGVIGRDCFNPQECEMITRQMAEEYMRQPQPQAENWSIADVRLSCFQGVWQKWCESKSTQEFDEWLHAQMHEV